MRRGDYRNYYKGHMDKIKGEGVLQSKGWWWFLHDKLLQKGFPLSVSGGSFPHAHLLGSKCLPPEERRLSMPETGEKERNCLFKSYTDRVMA